MPAGAKTSGMPRITELGVDLLQLSRVQVARAIGVPFVAFAAYWMLAGAGHWALAVASLVVLSFVTYGSTSHDLVHRHLGLSRLTNDILLAVIEAISLRSGHAYQAAHLNHHARFPHDDDIEAEAAGMSLPRAALEGIVFQARIYGWALRHAPGKRKWIVGEGLVVASIVVASMAVAWYSIVPAVYVALMIVGSWTIPIITSYIPHDPKAADVLHQTRAFRGAVARIVACDHLYHLEHHLYPQVPHQNWPRLARRLGPWFDAAGVRAIRIGF